MKYDLVDGRGIRLWLPGMALPDDFCAHVRNGGLLEAHNSGFELWINWYVMVPRYSFPRIALGQTRCSMAKARAWSLPPSLDDVGDALALDVRKDKDGKRLLDKFSVPRNPTKADPRLRLRPADDPADALRLYAYNERDVEAEQAVSARVPELSPLELEYWLLDRDINIRGIHCDRDGVNACIELIEATHAKYNAELVTLTGGTVQRGSELQKLMGWLGAQGVHTASLDEENVTRLLARDDIAAPAHRALEIRAALGSASVKKVYAMANQMTEDDRLHDLFAFHGARTGRPTGSGPQPTNLPRSGPDCFRCDACSHWFAAHHIFCPHCGALRGPGAPAEWNADAVEDALCCIKTRAPALVEHVWGDAMAVLSGCLRGLFDAAPGNDLICSDYSAIEAVVNACMSGEQWRIDVFNSHGKIYEASAAQSFKVPLEEILAYPATHDGHKHPLRQKGKIAELAFGYLGWINAARRFGMPGTDEEIKADILAWREASPAIVYLGGGQSTGWGYDKRACLYGLEGMTVAAIQSPGERFPVMRLNGTFSGLTMFVDPDADVLYMELPDTTRLAYHHPRLDYPTASWRGLSITFRGWNTNPTMGMMGWVPMTTYAGKLLENACQAVANRIQRYGQVALARAGYPTVQHVYDENCAEVPEGFGSIEEFERIMSTMPAWAADWPIRATGGWRGKRYRK